MTQCCCCEQGLRGRPWRTHTWAAQAVRWSVARVLNTQESAMLAHAVLVLNIEIKTPNTSEVNTANILILLSRSTSESPMCPTIALCQPATRTATEPTGQEAVHSGKPFEAFLEESAQGFYPVLGERQGLAKREEMAWEGLFVR